MMGRSKRRFLVLRRSLWRFLGLGRWSSLSGSSLCILILNLPSVILSFPPRSCPFLSFPGLAATILFCLILLLIIHTAWELEDFTFPPSLSLSHIPSLSCCWRIASCLSFLALVLSPFLKLGTSLLNISINFSAPTSLTSDKNGRCFHLASCHSHQSSENVNYKRVHSISTRAHCLITLSKIFYKYERYLAFESSNRSKDAKERMFVTRREKDARKWLKCATASTCCKTRKWSIKKASTSAGLQTEAERVIRLCASIHTFFTFTRFFCEGAKFFALVSGLCHWRGLSDSVYCPNSISTPAMPLQESK